MDPEKRVMLQVNPIDIERMQAEKIENTFKILMGDEVEPRRKFIEENAKLVANLDL